MVTYEIGAVGCYGACNETDVFKNGRCTHCDGYCCRLDGHDNKCSDDILNAVRFPALTRHYCVTEIVPAEVVPAEIVPGIYYIQHF